MSLREDVERAGERSAELAEMSDAQRIDRLRARILGLEKALKPFANIDTDLLPRHWDAARRAYNKSPTISGRED